MKRLILLGMLGFASAIATTATAQVSINVNVGPQPQPVYYRTVDYAYVPVRHVVVERPVYYHRAYVREPYVSHRVYKVKSHGNWGAPRRHYDYAPKGNWHKNKHHGGKGGRR